jgi:hypothetical protein
MEMIDIADYKDELARDFRDLDFRRAVVADLTRRRDMYCPVEQDSEFGSRVSDGSRRPPRSDETP